MGVGVAVGVAVALGVAVGIAVGVGVAVAVGVGVGLGVGVGVGLIVLTVCMAIISLSDNAVSQIAACWMLPLAYPVVPLSQHVHQARSVARAPGVEGSSSRSDAGAINK